MPDYSKYSNFNKKANMHSVKFGADTGITELELNELQDIQNEARADLIRDSIPSGFIKLSDFDFATMSTSPNTIKLLSDSIAYVNGYRITIPSGTVITLDAPPADISRDDLVFLEVWKEEVTKDSTINTLGQAGVGAEANTLLDARLAGDESAHRIQLKWRLRAVSGVDFSQLPEGFTLTGTTANWNTPSVPRAQGGNSSPISTTLTNVYTDACKSSFINASYVFNKDYGLYVSGDGTQSSKDLLKTLDGYVYAIPMFKVHRRASCGYGGREEYSKVSPLINSIYTQRVVDGAKVANSGDSSLQVTVNGNTLVNILGKAGNCEAITGYWFIAGSMSVDTSGVKLFGNNSIKGVCNNVSGILIKDIPCDQTHKYFVSAYAYINSFTSGGIGVSTRDYGTSSNPTSAIFDSTRLNQWQRASLITTGKLGGGFRLYVGDSQGATSVNNFNLDGICVYDLTALYGAGNEPTDIPFLERTLPFVDGVQSSKPVAIRARGKNVLDSKNYSNKSVDITDTSKGFIFPPNAPARVVTFNPTLIPNKTYTLSFTAYTASGTANISADVFPDIYPEILPAGGSLITTTPTRVSGTFTVPQNFVYDYSWSKGIRIYTSATQTTSSAIYVEDIMLSESPDTTYVPYKASQIILPTGVFDDLKKLGTVSDSVDLVRKVYKKNISDWMILDGSLPWTSTTNYNGFKRTGFSLALNGVNDSDLAIKYNGLPLAHGAWSKGDVAQLYTGSYFASVDNNDSGWGDGYTASSGDVKAYFNGWKMCHSDGSSPYLPSVIPYTGSTWAEWAKGTGVTADSTGMTLTSDGSSWILATINGTQFKASTKYGLLYNVVSSTISGDLVTNGGIFNYMVLPKTVGNNKSVLTTLASLTNTLFGLQTYNTEASGKVLKLKDIRIFELPSGSQIESDFNTLTPDQLVAKYPFMNTCSKYWKKITDGTGMTPNQPVISYPDYTPYKMIYQLATPVETDIKDLVKGRLYANSNEPSTFDIEQVTTKPMTPVLLPNLIQNGNFSNGFTGWFYANTSAVTVASNIAKFTATSSGGYIAQTIAGGTTGSIVGHKYYMRAVVKSSSSSVRVQSGTTYKYHSGGGSFEALSIINTATVTNQGIGIADMSASGWSEVQVKQAYTIDLTDLFGAGNEPSKEWCDKYFDFENNYTIKSPVYTTMFGALYNRKRQFLGAKNNICVIPASKWNSGLYEALYKDVVETHVNPNATLAIGSQTLSLSTNIGSLTLADSDVPYKKSGDGSVLYSTNCTIVSPSPSPLYYGDIGSAVVSASFYNLVKVGDKLYTPSLAYQGQLMFEVVSKLDNNTITIKNVRPNLGSAGGITVVPNLRPDGLLADIVDTTDIANLRHQVSLTGFNYQQLLEENFDKLLRGEL